MSDEFDSVRRLRPDKVTADDPGDPAVLSREKERLMSVIDDTGSEEQTTWRLPDIFPRLAYQDERAALEYLVRVFGFTEQREARREPDEEDKAKGWGMLAWLKLGEGVVMIGRENTEVHRIQSPRTAGGETVIVHVQVHDIDAHYRRAVAEGAEITMELEDAFYGYRRYEANDLEGHRWHFAESHDDIRARGGVVDDDGG